MGLANFNIFLKRKNDVEVEVGKLLSFLKDDNNFTTSTSTSFFLFKKILKFAKYLELIPFLLPALVLFVPSGANFKSILSPILGALIAFKSIFMSILPPMLGVLIAFK